MNSQNPTPNRARSSHGRAASGDERRRVAVPRPSARGPLDEEEEGEGGRVEDPLSTTKPPSPLSPNPLASDKDFSFLQDPQSYNPLPTTNIPTPFLSAPNLPTPQTPLSTLLSTGHYRQAAISSVQTLLTLPPTSTKILHLFHTRLACLILLNLPSLAAQESKLLGDLTSPFYLSPITKAHIIPWDLRILVIRLTALGYSEWRKGIMSYYELAREARSSITSSNTDEEKELWRSRLRECGIRVANMLIEMGDLEGAAHHLATLSSSQESNTDILIMETLTYLRIGDITTAHVRLSRLSPSSSQKTTAILTALLSLSNSSLPTSLTQWETLHKTYPTDAMISQNLAIVLLYMGQISETRALLTELAETSPPFHSLVFNLCTVFELCSERNREEKLGLAGVLAGRDAGEMRVVGWEVRSEEFKL